MMQFVIPNTIKNLTDFYISYNSVDWDIYESDTTAIVIGQMSRFYILNGNHTREMEKLGSFEACIDYFLKNEHLRNKYSNRYDEQDANLMIKGYQKWLELHPPKRR